MASGDALTGHSCGSSAGFGGFRRRLDFPIKPSRAPDTPLRLSELADDRKHIALAHWQAAR